MFARFDENQAMTLQDIKETKCYGRTHGHTDGRTDNVKNSIPTTNKVCGGYNECKKAVKNTYVINKGHFSEAFSFKPRGGPPSGLNRKPRKNPLFCW